MSDSCEILVFLCINDVIMTSLMKLNSVTDGLTQSLRVSDVLPVYPLQVVPGELLHPPVLTNCR